MHLVIEPHPAELGDDLGEVGGVRGQVEQAVAARTLFLLDLLEKDGQSVVGGRVGEVALVIGQALRESLPGLLVDWQHP